MQGKGLLQGMKITLKTFFGKKETLQYPEVKLTMPERFRGGALKLDHKKCIACGLCAMSCPNRVIELATGTDEQKKRYLTKYIYHSGLCLYCNYCVEACPTKAICWDKNYENARYFREDLDVDCLALSKHTAEIAEKQAGEIEPTSEKQSDDLEGRTAG